MKKRERTLPLSKRRFLQNLLYTNGRTSIKKNFGNNILGKARLLSLEVFSIKQRGLLCPLPRTMNHPRCFYAPEAAEQVDSRRAMSSVVVICKSQDHDSPLL